MSASASLGVRIRTARQRKGMSQAELAGSELSVSYISLIESGKREPTPATLAGLAARLDVDVQWLVSGVEPKEREHRELKLRYAQLALTHGEASEALAQLRQLMEEVLGAAAGEVGADSRAGAGAEAGGDAGGERVEAFAWEVRTALAAALEATGDLVGAVSVLEDLRELAERDPARWPWVETVISLSRCYREAGDLRRAIDVGESALGFARDLGAQEVVLLPRLVSTLAAAYYERGDLVRAQQLLDRALADAERSGDRRQRGSVLWNTSIVAYERGKFADALRLADRALGLLSEEGDLRAVARLKVARAAIALASPGGDAASARELLRSALPALTDTGSEVDVAYAETELARADLRLGDPEESARLARSALERLGPEPRLESARARLCLAASLTALGRDQEADACTLEAGAVLEQLRADRQAAQVWRQLAEAQLARGDVERAADSFRRALDAGGVPATESDVDITQLTDLTGGADLQTAS